MAKFLMMLIVGGALFGTAAAASWFLKPVDDKAQAESSDASMPAGKSPENMADNPSRTTSPAITATGIPAETVLRLSESIKNRELQLKQREELIVQREKRLKFMIGDLQRERIEITAMLENAEERTQAARELLERVQQLSLTSAVDASSQIRTGPNGASAVDDEQPMSDQEQENLKTVAKMLQGMPPEQSADTIRKYCNDGKMEMAVKLLAFMEERDASKILGALSDAALVADLLERYRALKMTWKK